MSLRLSLKRILFGALILSGLRTTAEDLTLKSDLNDRLRERMSIDLIGLPILAPTWDEAFNFALELRGRTRCVAAGVTRDISGQVQRGAQTLVHELVMCEAGSSRMKKSGILEGRETRGWGTLRATRIGQNTFSNMVEAQSTTMVMVAIAEALRQFGDWEGAEEARTCFKAVVDSWMVTMMKEHPQHGRYFLRADVEDKGKESLSYYTQAQWAIALLHASEAFPSNGKEANLYRTLAVEFARQILKGVVVPVVRDGIHTERWAYGPDSVKRDGSLSRPEDVTHGAQVVEMVALFLREKVKDGGQPMFLESDLKAFAQILSTQILPRSEGKPVTRIYYDGEELKKGPKWKDTVSNWQAVTNTEAGWASAVGWKRSFSPEDKSLDTGFALRTSWGWVMAATTDKTVFKELGQFFQSAWGDRVGKGDISIPNNAFLSLATYREGFKYQ